MKASELSPEVLDAPGLPRPLRRDPRGVRRPVPWTQGDKDWGDVEDPRMDDARASGLCLVCGELVTEGVVLWNRRVGYFSNPQSPKLPPAVVTLSLLGTLARHIADGGCLHKRCAKMTKAHCRTIREQFDRDEMLMVPYRHSTDTGA